MSNIQESHSLSATPHRPSTKTAEEECYQMGPLEQWEQRGAGSGEARSPRRNAARSRGRTLSSAAGGGRKSLTATLFRLKKTNSVTSLFAHACFPSSRLLSCRINVFPSWWTTEMVTNSMYDTKSWELSSKSDFSERKERSGSGALWLQREIQAWDICSPDANYHGSQMQPSVLPGSEWGASSSTTMQPTTLEAGRYFQWRKLPSSN